MKLIYLPVLIWTLAISQLFAQKDLAPSIRPYVNTLDASVKMMLHDGGFNVPGMPGAVENSQIIETRSPDLQLDSTATFGTYSPTDSVPVSRTLYSYPQDDVRVVIEMMYVFSEWTIQSRTTFQQDDLGRNINILAESYNPDQGTYVPNSRIILFPHEESLILADSFRVDVWSEFEKDWVTQLTNWNVYDAQDKLLEAWSSINFFMIPIVFVDRYTYNPQGQVSLIESFNLEAGEEFEAGRQEFFYDGNLLASAVTLTSDGNGNFLPQDKIEYTYTPAGVQENVSHYTYDFAKNDWALWRVEGYIYDSENRTTALEVNTLDGQGIWVRSKTEYSYVEDTYIDIETLYAYDDNIEDWIINERTFYYYKDLTATDPDPINDQALFLYPNPTQGSVQIQLPGKVSVFVYTLTGQLIKSYYMAPGEKLLDFSAMPAGMYQVRAKSDEDYFSGKLIIQ